MNFKQRFFLLFGLLAFLLTLIAIIVALNEIPPEIKLVHESTPILPSFLVGHEKWFNGHQNTEFKHVPIDEENRLRGSVTKECRFDSCFDLSLCANGFKVHMHEVDELDLPHPSPSSRYADIISALRASRYYTSNASEACLFITPLDTLDRDRLSQEYVRDLPQRLALMEERWRNGRNHLVFNLYPGTWPDYDENDLGFVTGRAMLARSSISHQYFRTGFDIAFPLFHREHWRKGGEPGHVSSIGGLARKRYYTLVFKGKRYLSGIGSETRNSLYHINNERDIILLTTCKHGKTWKAMEDSRCAKDNADYDRFDYKALLKNSTFCLVPRGRRLGSYRFLEALQAGCIPVILSNGWVLPFSEVIDWNRAVVWADERLLLQIPSIVKSINEDTILSLRQQTQFLWETYFASIEKIVETTLEIIKDRLSPTFSRSPKIWNSVPGALVHLPEYSQLPYRYPFYNRPSTDIRHGSHVPRNWRGKYTAVILVAEGNLNRIIKVLHKCKNLEKVILLWLVNANFELPTSKKWSSIIHQPIINRKIKNLNEIFDIYSLVKTDAILSLEEDTKISPDEIEFGFSVWQNFPDRIVGYTSRSHFWDESSGTWKYTTKPTQEISIVLTSASFYHRYFAFLYSHYLPSNLLQLVIKAETCHDLLLNALVSHVTKLSPIKTGERRIVNQLKLYSLDVGESNIKLLANNRSYYFNQSILREFTSDPINSNLQIIPKLIKFTGAQYVNQSKFILSKNLYLKNSNLYADKLLLTYNNQSKLTLSTSYQSKLNNDVEELQLNVLARRNFCLNRIVEEFGYMPLKKSSFRLDPLLFKDPVSIVRKKYRAVEVPYL